MPIVRPTPTLSESQPHIRQMQRELEMARAQATHRTPTIAQLQAYVRQLKAELALERAKNSALQAQLKSRQRGQASR